MSLCRPVLLVLVAVLLLPSRPSAGAAGHYLEEELITSSAGRPPRLQTTRTWLVAGKQRKEVSPGASVTIVRDDLERLFVLDTDVRTYFELSREAVERVGEQGLAAMQLEGKEDPSAWVRRTGNRKRVGEWEAYEVRVEDRPIPGARLSLWLSVDVPIERALRTGLVGGVLGESGQAAALLRLLRDLEGWPVEVTLEARVETQIFELRQTLKKVEKVDVPDDRFELPAGFRRVASPLEVEPVAAGSGAPP